MIEQYARYLSDARLITAVENQSKTLYDYWRKIHRGPRHPREVVDLRDWQDADDDHNLSGELFIRQSFVNGNWVGLHHDMAHGPCHNLVIRDCEFRDHEKWASRAYRIAGAVVEFCRFADVTKEHGKYWNIAGGGDGIIVRDCVFEDIGSQALQYVQRADEQGVDLSSDITPGGPIRVLRCDFRNIGCTHGDRPSFALSFFPSMNDVVVDDCHLDNATDQVTSFGALLCQGHPSLTVTDSSFILAHNDRPIAKIEDTPFVLIENSHFECQGLQRTIEINRCPNVTVRGCTGNVVLKINGTDRALNTE